MQRILVTGANGFVGRPLCEELVRQGYIVRAVMRDASQTQNTCEVIKVQDIGPDTDWVVALSGVETIIHLAARAHIMNDAAADPLQEFRRVNVEGTRRLAYSAAAVGVKRLVYISSVKVNGESTSGNNKYVETDAPAPEDAYGISKYEAEQVLHHVAAETGLEVVILRPPLIYGANVKGNFAQMLRILRKGLPLPLGAVNNLRSLLYVGNLVDALILCARHPAAKGQTYLVSDGEDVSTSDLLRMLADAMGRSIFLFSCPCFLLKAAGPLTGKSTQMTRLLGSLRVDSSKIRQELDWVPPSSLQQGLHATVQ